MKGKVEKLNLWNSGRGFFFEIEGQSYAGHGTPTFVPGDVIEFERDRLFGKDGKRYFANNIRKAEGIEAFLEENKVSMDILANKQPDRGAQIRKLAVMKMAVRLTAATLKEDATLTDVMIKVRDYMNALEEMI